MRQLLLGRSGSGKSQVVFDRLEELVRQGREKLFLLVPEQYSFESERTLLRRLGTQAAARVQVLSFTHLVGIVLRELGGVAGEELDDGMRALLMSRALEQVSQVAEDHGEPLLGADPRQVTDSAYVEDLLVLRREMQQCAVSPSELEDVYQQLAEQGLLTNRSLREKAKDFYRIFTTYEGLVAASGLDDTDSLSRLAEKLPQSSLPDGAVVLVDGFKGFTTQELAVLEQLFVRVDEMILTLGTDTAGSRWSASADHTREHTLFEPVTDTVERLREMASRHHRRWELRLLAENHRHADGALRALEAGLYAPAPTVYTDEAKNITLTPCRNEYEECEYVARCIRRLLREEQYRCRDIIVVARDLSTYRGILEDALDTEGVPYTIDLRQSLLDEPLIVYIRAALRIAVGGLRTEEILRLLKTDLGTLSPTDIARLENYVYMWNIDAVAWEEEWTENPSGLGAPVTSQTAHELAQLNAWRQAIVTPLNALRDALRGGADGYRFALAVYRFLTDGDMLAGGIWRQVADLEAVGEPLLAERCARLWDEVINILDRFAAVLSGQRLPSARLEELFTMLSQMIDIGQIPQGLDAVTIGSAERIRYHHPRAVFILGANEGVFPCYPDTTGLLTEEDRRTLSDCGMELSGNLFTRCIEERYYAYMAVAAPSERLTVTYRTEGENTPSPLVTAIETILPGRTCGVATVSDGSDLECAEAMFARLAEEYTASTTLTESLRAALAEEKTFDGRLAAVERGVGRVPFRLADEQVARDLFGTDLRLSASQTDKFYQCHFSYFCRYGLYLQPRKVAGVDAAFFGIIVHYVMETLLPEYVRPDGLVARIKEQDEKNKELDKPASAEAENRLQSELLHTITEAVHKVVLAYIDKEMGGTQKKSGRFLYQVGLAERSACNMLWHTVMELRQSAFSPVGFEVGIFAGEEKDLPENAIPSIHLTFPRGSVRLSGKVDRLDLFVRFDGKAFVRVVDYKTGTKTFDLNELSAGLNMQMLLYLYTICDHPEQFLKDEGELSPAGVLYHPLSDLLVDRRMGDKVQIERLRSMKMDGVVLNDASVVQAMEADGGKVFIPAYIGKDGTAKGSVLTADQFTLLRSVVEQLLVRMANRLLDGNIAALPIQKGDYSPCSYCDYRAVCARDEDDDVSLLTERSMQEVLEEMQRDAKEEVSNDE